MNSTTDSDNDLVEATCVRLNAKAADAASIAPAIERHPLSRRPDEVVVAIEAAGVNPSDVKAATGLMPYAVFPRTPGRDLWAGGCASCDECGSRAPREAGWRER